MRKPLHIKNDFIDTETYPYEVMGFFEELIDLDTGKMVGVRMVETLDRPMGEEGRREFLLTETIEIVKGARLTMLKASPSRPKRLVGKMQALCGKAKPAHQG